ncbi:MAG: adenylate/guanylate cyclase domain-containing protein [Candidatus Binataceae bacterium]
MARSTRLRGVSINSPFAFLVVVSVAVVVSLFVTVHFGRESEWTDAIYLRQWHLLHARFGDRERGRVAVVLLDDPATAAADPMDWSPEQYRALIDALAAEGASLIGFDGVFQEITQGPVVDDHRSLWLPPTRLNQGPVDSQTSSSLQPPLVFAYEFVQSEFGRIILGTPETARFLHYPYNVSLRNLPPKSWWRVFQEALTNTEDDGRIEQSSEYFEPPKQVGNPIAEGWRIHSNTAARDQMSSVIEYQGDYYPCLPMVLASIGLGKRPELALSGSGVDSITMGERVLPAQRAGWMIVSPKTRDIQKYSALGVLRHTLPKDSLRGTVVIAGRVENQIDDPNPSHPISPVVLDAEFTEAILDGTLQRIASPSELSWLMVTLIAGSLTILWVASRYRPLTGILLSAAGLASLMVLTIAWEIFDEVIRNVVFYWPQIWPNIAIVYGTSFSILSWRTLSERRKFRSAFEHYVDPKIIEKVLADPDGLELGGELRHVTVLFADIVDFTKRTEHTPPKDMVSILNTYMGAMIEVVIQHEGVVDKLMGDAVMAFWGAPLRTTHGALSAVNCALAMLDGLDRLRGSDSRFANFDIGIGIATGDVVAGNIGGQQRFDYSIIGDTVNLASRLEGLTRQLNVHILVDGSTLQGAERNFVVRDIGLVRVKGKDDPVEVSEVIGAPQADGRLAGEDEQFCTLFSTAVRQAREGHFEEARALLEKLALTHPDDPGVRLYLSHPMMVSGVAGEKLILEFTSK